MLNKLKVNCPSLSCHETEFTGQTFVLKSGEIGKFRKSQWDLLARNWNSRGHKLVELLNGNLMSGWRLNVDPAWEWETIDIVVLGWGTHLWILPPGIPLGSHGEGPSCPQINPLMALAGEGKEYQGERRPRRREAKKQLQRSHPRGTSPLNNRFNHKIIDCYPPPHLITTPTGLQHNTPAAELQGPDVI